MQPSQKGWHTRGYLPHFDAEVIQFITFRLHDSLPQSILSKLQLEKEHGKLYQYDRELQIKIEDYLDSGIGTCALNQDEIAKMVRDALIFYDNKAFELQAWVLMPNHITFVIRILGNRSLADVMKNLKGYTARCANKLLGQNGPFWQPDYFDRFIRDEAHYRKAVAYIENNPVKAGLCVFPSDWPY